MANSPDLADQAAPLAQTPLHAWHQAEGARLVPFAGYAMPVHYPLGILGEHLFVRESAGLFDVSHMGQAFVQSSDWEKTARALEALVPADLLALAPGQQRYSQLLGADGGILDDLMITRSANPSRAGEAYLVVNAARKQADFALIAAALPQGVRLRVASDLALIALQGPNSASILADLGLDWRNMPFMTSQDTLFEGLALHLSRSGYCGEDGFEIALSASSAPAFWARLAADPRVRPIGLGARDSLRLEAGLCLYGHDIDETTSPVEAGLAWSIQKRRRLEGGFPGAARILRELADGPSRRRVGLRLEGKQPAREGAEIFAQARPIGRLTSGGFAPSLGAPIGMGYVEAQEAVPGAAVSVLVRGKYLPARLVPLPFVPNRFFRAA